MRRRAWKKRRGSPPPPTEKKSPPPHRWHLKTCNQALHRHCHDRLPLLLRLTYIHTLAQAAAQIAFFSWSNLQINPQSIRCHFNFLITIRVRSSRLQKHLAYIPIPKSVAPSRGFRIRKNVDAPVPRIESQKQEIRVPQKSHLRFPLPIRVLPLPIRTKRNTPSCIPSSLWLQTL